MPYWWVQCYECGEIKETIAASLNKGTKSCACGRLRQNYAYISLISEDGIPLGVKFGITARPKERHKEQDKKSLFDVSLLFVYKFSKVDDCKSAELEVKKMISCGIFNKEEIPDGYTETTGLNNIDNIIKIYKQFGGEMVTI